MLHGWEVWLVVYIGCCYGYAIPSIQLCWFGWHKMNIWQVLFFSLHLLGVWSHLVTILLFLLGHTPFVPSGVGREHKMVWCGYLKFLYLPQFQRSQLLLLGVCFSCGLFVWGILRMQCLYYKRVIILVLGSYWLVVIFCIE